MKIIDFERKGNLVRFYLGADELESWHGDDWDDAPYEHNAGPVYDEFVAGKLDVAFPFDALVLEPASGVSNTNISKDDLAHRILPALIIVPAEQAGNYWWGEHYGKWLGTPGTQEIYFGDNADLLSGYILS